MPVYSSTFMKFCHSPPKLDMLPTPMKEEVQKYMTKNPGMHVNRYSISVVFSQACMTMANCRAGFRVTGIFPLNRDAVVLPNQQFGRFMKETNLKNIPLFSPAPRRSQISAQKVELESDSMDNDCSSDHLSLQVIFSLTKSFLTSSL